MPRTPVNKAIIDSVNVFSFLVHPVKVIIQIPCANEARTLPLVLKDMPRRLYGVDQVEIQIIDDGCTDDTVQVALEAGVNHVVRVASKNRRWLGRAFRAGIDHALQKGADIVVNTDGDNQYPSSSIPELIKPILEGKADIVIGDRNPGKIAEFSPLKRFLQRLGSRVVCFFTGEPIPDAVSGFRAYSRKALLQIHITTDYTYTVDTLIQAHQKGLDVAWIPIDVNRKTRESRLITGLWAKVRKSGLTILKVSTVYRPMRTFAWLSLLFLIPGFLLIARFLFVYSFIPERASGHIQSVVIGAGLLVMGLQSLFLGIIGDLLGTNRKLIEDILTRVRKMESENSSTLEQGSSKEPPKAVNI